MVEEEGVRKKRNGLVVVVVVISYTTVPSGVTPVFTAGTIVKAVLRKS